MSKKTEVKLYRYHPEHFTLPVIAQDDRSVKTIEDAWGLRHAEKGAWVRHRDLLKILEALVNETDHSGYISARRLLDILGT